MSPQQEDTMDMDDFEDLLPVSRTEAGPGIGSPDKPTAVGRLQALPAAALMCEPRPAAVIEGAAWAGRITVLVSESGSGKTFLLLGAAAAIGDGRAWHGRSVRRGSVAYISYEGDAFGLRLKALREAGYSLEDLYVIRAGEPLSPRIERDGTEHPSIGESLVMEALAELQDRLVAAGKRPVVLVIIDTVRAALAGSEDNSEDVSAFLRAARRLVGPYPDAAIILAHHAGWQDGEQKRKRERGSSAFRGNADATLYLEVSEEDAEQHLAYLTLRTLKVRDEERPAPLRLIRRRVAVEELDERGQPRTTCLIERDPRRREDLEAEHAQAMASAAADLEQRALDAIAGGNVTSIAGLRALLGCRQPVAADLLARLLTSGRINRQGQRDSYRVVPSRTSEEPVRVASRTVPPPPTGGTGTTREQPSRKGRVVPPGTTDGGTTQEDGQP